MDRRSLVSQISIFFTIHFVIPSVAKVASIPLVGKSLLPPITSVTHDFSLYDEFESDPYGMTNRSNPQCVKGTEYSSYFFLTLQTSRFL